MEILELLISLEKKLHSFDSRASREKLNILLSEDFHEIGASGKTYGKNETIDLLIKSKSYEIVATDFELKKLSSDIMQLIYKAKSKGGLTDTRYTVRSSLWKKNGHHWQMIFHQGTIINEISIYHPVNSPNESKTEK